MDKGQEMELAHFDSTNIFGPSWRYAYGII